MKQNNLVLIIFLLISSLLTANDFNTNMNYFGNLTTSSLNKDGFNTKGYEVDDVKNHFQLSTYSKLGIQATIYNDDWMFVTQAVTHYKDNGLKADLTWLNVKYTLNSDFNIRGGRMQSSAFLNSDVRDIDYVNTWGLEPNAFYTMLPMKFYDGIEISYNKVIGEYYINLNLTPYGTLETSMDDLVSDSILSVKDIHIISFDISNNDFKFKVTYGQVNINIPIEDTNYNQVIDGLKEENDMSKYNYTDKKVSFLTLGLEYNYENYSLVSELAQISSNSLIADTIGYYTMLSYRYDKFIPFVMYSVSDNQKSHFDTTNIVDNSNQHFKEKLDQILYQTNNSQKTISLGFKYDLMVGVALKFQLDKITIKDYGVDYSETTKRVGYTQRDAGVYDDSVYQTTIGLSFVF